MTTSRRQLTRQLSGRAKSRYVRAMMRQAGATEAATAKADAEIRSIVVAAPAAERLAPARPIVQPRPAARAAAPDASIDHSPPPAPAKSVLPPAAAAPEREIVAFNPYAFSAMAVLLNEGRAALEARLAEASTREHIVQLAEAQSVRLDPRLLSAKKTSIAALRTAFVEAVEKRVAHRRAITG